MYAGFLWGVFKLFWNCLCWWLHDSEHVKNHWTILNGWIIWLANYTYQLLYLLKNKNSVFHPFSRAAAPLLLPLAELRAPCSGRLPIHVRLPVPSILPGLRQVHFTKQSIIKKTGACSSLLGTTWTGWDSWEPGRNGCTEGRERVGLRDSGRRGGRPAPATTLPEAAPRASSGTARGGLLQRSSASSARGRRDRTWRRQAVNSAEWLNGCPARFSISWSVEG